MDSDSIRIVETLEESKSGEGTAIVVPTLRLDDKVRPLVNELSALAQSAEMVSVWRPLHAYARLRELRKKFAAITPTHREILNHCHRCMMEPVEGAATMENAWFQGYSTALGTSAILQLQSAFQAVGEVIDRKAAYGLAALSLYIAVFSMLLTVLFGWLSFK
jgi:hypothetical protein